MSTKNRRAAVYLPSDIDEALAIFKDNRRIDGDSAALIAILREFFELGATKAHQSSPELIEERLTSLEKGRAAISFLANRVEVLERQLVEQAQQFGELKALVAQPQPTQLKSADSSEVTLSLPLATDAQKSSELSPLGTEALARRFGIGKDAVQRWVGKGQRAKTPEQIEKTTKERDPAGIAWSYDLSSRLFYPQSSKPV